MAINSVSSSSLATAMQVRPQPEAKEVNQPGRDTRLDKSSDDGSKASVAAATKPSVNSNGQAIGTIINTTA